MAMFPPAAAPATKLGVYRQLSTTAGVHVSPLALGAMSIGDPQAHAGKQWKSLLGQIDKEASLKLLDAYFDAGGNFIDTANNYQDETSEMIIGEWAEKRGIRDQLFIATKYTTNYKQFASSSQFPQKIMYTGNNIKSMTVSVEDSLKKLRTTYIDLFYVHWWDWDTSVEEVMRGLHRLVLAGKVLYLGISDAPAWVVSKANQYARDHALTPFSVYQGKWNVMERDFEREIIPMARSEGKSSRITHSLRHPPNPVTLLIGMALAPWAAVGGGKFFTDAEEEARELSGERGRSWDGGVTWKRTPKERMVSAALEKVAKELGRGEGNLTVIALAYVLQKAPRVFPIVGGRKVEHLTKNIEALDITLTPEQIKTLEQAVEFDVGFPASFIGTGDDQVFLMKTAGRLEKPLMLQPHKPASLD